MLQSDLEAIKRAHTLIKRGQCTRIDLGCGMVMYKVPSNNPNKYTIRLNIKVNEEEN